MIDIKTVFVFSTILTLFNWIVMAMLWVPYRRRFAGINHWMLGYTFISTGMLVILFRIVLSEFFLFLFGNLLIVFGIFLLHTGLERFVEKPRTRIHNFIFLATFTTIHAYYSFVSPSLRLLSICVSAMIVIIFVQSAWLMLVRVKKPIHSGMLHYGVISGAFSLINAIQIVMVLIYRPGKEFYRIGEWNSWVQIANQIGLIALTFSLFLMVSRRLSVELETVILFRKQAEEKIKSLLQEKELLLKEVHHRIRNNMSTIMGLLSLQSGTLNNSEAKMALKEAQNRVQSMLVLYDKLFLSSDFQNVSTKQYFETLIDEIIKNFSNSNIVSVKYEIEDVMLSAKTIFDLGIIINELITNTMKHAFVGKEQGKISASLSADEGHATITIQDDGIELPESVSFENPAAGFGFKLVSMLVNQLDGSIQIDRGNGTKFTIKFNIET